MPSSNNMRYGNPSFKTVDSNINYTDQMMLTNNKLASYGLPIIIDSVSNIRVDPNYSIPLSDPLSSGLLWLDGSTIKVSNGTRNSNVVSVNISNNENYIINSKVTVVKSIGSINSYIFLPKPQQYENITINNRTGNPITILTNDSTTVENNSSAVIPTGTTTQFYFAGGDQWYTN